MQFLSSGPDDPNPGLVPIENSPFQDPTHQPPVMLTSAPGDAEHSIDPIRLLRRYWLLLAALMIVGAAAGFVSIVLSAPRYRSRLIMEVQSANGSLPKIGALDGGNNENNDINIQTQISILHSGGFLRRAADRMQSETVPLAPTGRDIFSRLRQRIRPATQDPLDTRNTGLAVAMATFDARPIIRTRLIELTCESTSPDVAAQFLNSMAAEFSDDGSRSRMQTAQRTGEWLAAQIEETKSKVPEAEEHLRDFVQASGNVFAGPGQDVTLEDTKLIQLKGELAKIQSERIARQTRYELTLKNPPEQLAEVLDNAVLRTYQGQLEGLKREKAALETTYTSKHEKVRKVDAQIALSPEDLRQRDRQRCGAYQERLRSVAPSGEAAGGGVRRTVAAGGIGSRQSRPIRLAQARGGDAAPMYQYLLVQQNEANMSSSVPINPIRVVEPSHASRDSLHATAGFEYFVWRHVWRRDWPAGWFF